MKIYTITAQYASTTVFTGKQYSFNSLCDTGDTVYSDRLSAEMMVDLLNQMVRSDDENDVDVVDHFNIYGDRSQPVKFTVTEMDVL